MDVVPPDVLKSLQEEQDKALEEAQAAHDEQDAESALAISQCLVGIILHALQGLEHFQKKRWCFKCGQLCPSSPGESGAGGLGWKWQQTKYRWW